MQYSEQTSFEVCGYYANFLRTAISQFSEIPKRLLYTSIVFDKCRGQLELSVIEDYLLLRWRHCIEFETNIYQIHDISRHIYKVHYTDVIMRPIASQITSLAIVYSTGFFFRLISKKTSKLRVDGLCAGNSPGAGEFRTQMVSNAEIVSVWWRHHDLLNADLIVISTSSDRYFTYLVHVIDAAHQVSTYVQTVQYFVWYVYYRVIHTIPWHAGSCYNGDKIHFTVANTILSTTHQSRLYRAQWDRGLNDRDWVGTNSEPGIFMIVVSGNFVP